MASNFFKNLTKSSDTIKESRAQIIYEDVESAQDKLMRTLKDEERALKRKLATLTDLYPDSELSLKVVKDGFSADQWVKELQNLKIQLLNKRVEIMAADETYKEQFADEDISE